MARTKWRSPGHKYAKKAEARLKKQEEGEEVEEEVEEEGGASDESGGEKKKVVVKKSKTPITSSSSSSSSSSTNDKSFNLSDKRKISYSNFKGLERIDIREFFEDKSGELKPSSKGISLTREQFMVILENGDTIKDWIKESK
ncbi:ssDNA-binding transcriptional regulator [Dictyostelium discoideum AX4]|uniref:SsDNA-binding transcriptional regulator n=1 Tax=Dictyostelium discoideum TaxID=44689 RepID=Q553Q8_DICDI|nr:ssDNA-binding transcriptional regulator [Dictyostelium discoideum AX4]EAL69733.1 ssDNA-binding transcriptional regulator [Dictyostelium discoideum AX4]|eukprot:XP_643662.1 ssDNA-binding transcriptional regulator [Dictyostelium discoideum AX4]